MQVTAMIDLCGFARRAHIYIYIYGGSTSAYDGIMVYIYV